MTTELKRKFAICRNIQGNIMTRVYWNREHGSWGPLSKMYYSDGSTTNGATIFDDEMDAILELGRIHFSTDAEVTAIWTDR